MLGNRIQLRRKWLLLSNFDNLNLLNDVTKEPGTRFRQNEYYSNAKNSSKNVQIQIKKAQPRRFARLARHCSIQSWWPSRNKLPNLANMREALSKNLSTTKSMIREIEIGRLRDQLVVVPFLDWGSWGHCIM